MGRAPRSSGSPAQPHIPRPPNSFILYRSELAKEMKDRPAGAADGGDNEGGEGQRNISRRAGRSWRTEPKEVKALYTARAAVAKAEHGKLYPDYKFEPRVKRAKENTNSKPAQSRGGGGSGRLEGKVKEKKPKDFAQLSGMGERDSGRLGTRGSAEAAAATAVVDKGKARERVDDAVEGMEGFGMDVEGDHDWDELMDFYDVYGEPGEDRWSHVLGEPEESHEVIDRVFQAMFDQKSVASWDSYSQKKD